MRSFYIYSVLLMLTVPAVAGVAVSPLPKDTLHFGQVWEDTIIAYYVDPKVPSSVSALIDQGVLAWNTAGLPIQILPGPSKRPASYIEFRIIGDPPCLPQKPSVHGNVNKIGHDPGKGEHSVCLSRTLATRHTVMHELGHVVGLIHEHEHCEASQFVQNVRKTSKFFQCAPGSTRSLDQNAEMLTPYDMRSVMHYNLSSKNSIKPAGNVELSRLHLSWFEIGLDPLGISQGDKETLEKLYRPGP